MSSNEGPCGRAHRGRGGFALVEAIVSTALALTLAVGVAQLVAVSASTVRNAADEAAALMLAVQRLEQLKGLAWTYRDDGRRVSDFGTDLAVDPPRPGGRGLRPSPADSLRRDVPGYVDYLDREGRVVGTGATPAVGTVFVRRWSVQPTPRHDANLLVLDVVVLTLSRSSRYGPRAPRATDPGIVWLTALKGRR